MVKYSMNDPEDAAKWLFSLTRSFESREDDRLWAIRQALDREDLPEKYRLTCLATTKEGDKCQREILVPDTTKCIHRGPERYK